LVDQDTQKTTDEKKKGSAPERFQIPQKVARGNTEDINPTRTSEFEIFDPVSRERLLQAEKHRGDFNIEEKAAKLQRRILTTEVDEYKLSMESRRLEEKQTAMLAESMKMPFINLYGFPIGPKALEKIPEEVAKEAEMIPFFYDEIEIRLGTIDPKNPKQKEIIDGLRNQGLLVTMYLISKASFNGSMRYYADVHKKEEIRREDRVTVTEEMMGELSDQIDELKNIRDRMENFPVTKIMDVIFSSAVKLKSSDVHFEPEEKEVRLRFRIDGVLQDAMSVHHKVYKQLLSRLKLISHLKVNVANVPQDGRFSVDLPNGVLDIRVSILPSGYGESVVCRLLGVGAMSLDVKKLGFSEYNMNTVMKQLDKPYGMVLVTGPTGSGKTTTLYSFLNFMNKPDVKIITLEDPIEYRLVGIQQTQIDREAGLDFASGLRSILRHDPDIVLVGEIRDLETAEIAINAAQTGHIVFSTLHTNDAAGVLPRLINMGLRQFVIAPALNAIIAQRLVRVLCNNCKQAYDPSAEDIALVEKVMGHDLMEKYIPREFKLYKPSRCKECATGFKGRMGIHEVFEINSDMEKLIMRSATVAEIREAAIAQGMILMQQDGFIKAVNGQTTLDEVIRVAGT
jgi:type IV pilus assembly protein PilB